MIADTPERRSSSSRSALGSGGSGPEAPAWLRDSLQRALLTEGNAVRRLSSAGTSVTFLVVDAPELSVTLLLDRDPPEVADASQPAEITIELVEEQADRLARGELPLPTCMHRGDVAFSGPVRRYLPFDPVLRALLARQSGNER